MNRWTLIALSLALLSGCGGGAEPVDPYVAARNMIDSARGDMIVRMLRRGYEEELELYGVPTVREVNAMRDEFILECVTAADADAAANDLNVELDTTTEYCEELARLAFIRAGID